MSKPVVVDIPHDLGRAGARERLEKGFDRIGAQLGGKVVALDTRWEGDRMSFTANAFGQRVAGRVDVYDKSVRIELDLPWLLATIAEKLTGRIGREARLLLEKK
jgi:putative polyhydroxyalkanoate system protein